MIKEQTSSVNSEDLIKVLYHLFMNYTHFYTQFPHFQRVKNNWTEVKQIKDLDSKFIRILKKCIHLRSKGARKVAFEWHMFFTWWMPLRVNNKIYNNGLITFQKKRCKHHAYIYQTTERLSADWQEFTRLIVVFLIFSETKILNVACFVT